MTTQTESWACNCVGPQNGQPYCPCQMRNVQIKEGRYVRPEQDLGLVETIPSGKTKEVFVG